MEKSDIRREVRQRIKALSPEERMAEARSIFDRVEALDSFHKAQCVAAFVAMPDEVPTKEILGRWLKLGKRIVVPRVEGDIMRFYDYSPDRIVVGAYGIEEPQGNDEVAHREIDLIIVPLTHQLYNKNHIFLLFFLISQKAFLLSFFHLLQFLV